MFKRNCGHFLVLWGAPVRTGTLLVVPGGPAAQGENSPVMTGQRDTHEGERDMMDSHTGGEKREKIKRAKRGPTGIKSGHVSIENSKSGSHII